MAVLADQDIAAVATAMLGVLNKGGRDLLQYARTEAENFAHSIETIVDMRAKGEIGEQTAADQLQLQKDASATVLASAAGITQVVAVQAVNAGLAAVGGIVNKAIGFALLPTA